jgi:hypothetical protein
VFQRSAAKLPKRGEVRLMRAISSSAVPSTVTAFVSCATPKIAETEIRCYLSMPAKPLVWLCRPVEARIYMPAAAMLPGLQIPP